MKRFGQIMCSVLFAFCMFGFVACGPDDKEITVKSVAVNNLNEFYQVTGTIDFDKINVTVTYSDKSTTTLTKGEFDITTETAKEDTQFIINTAGLYSQTAGELTVGEYKLTCVLIGNETVFDIKTVTVFSDMSLNYDVISYKEPEFVSVYNNNCNVVTNKTDTAYESSFYKSADYYVGDDNEFKFKPILTVQKKNDTTANPIVIDRYDVDVKVEVKNGDAFDVVNDNAYYTYEDFAFKFKETAIGKTFRISVSQNVFAADFAGDKIAPIVFTFTVADGWNAYSAIDLGRISLVSDYIKTNYYDENNQPINNPYSNEVSSKIFWTGNGANTEKRAFYPIWENFLTSKGSTDLRSINGLFMHGDITVTADDLPSEFFISEAEAAANNNQRLAGTLRDFALLYTHYMENDFLFNGNLFKLDCSSIKWGLTNIEPDEYYYEAGQTQFYAGHSTVLCFFGRIDETNTTKATVLNVEAVGNSQEITSSDKDKNNDVLEASGSLIFLKSCQNSTIVENCIAKSWLIAWFANNVQTKTCLDMDYIKTYDCYNSGGYSWRGAKNEISNAEFKRFGGPALFNVTGYNSSGEQSAGWTLDKQTCTIESYISGNEAWFTLFGANKIITQFTALDPLLNAYGTTILKDGKMNMICLNIDQDYLTSTESRLPADFSMIGDGEQKFDMHPSNTNVITQILTSTEYKTPVIMSSGGQVAYVSDTPQMHLEYVASTNASFTGDLLYVAYPISGINGPVAGVIVERYDYTAPSA